MNSLNTWKQPPERTSADRLLITSGGMQGLDLAAKLFVDPGDLVIVEAPTYANGSATVLAYGADILEAPIDDEGMIVEALPDLVQRAGRLPKAIYVIPNFQHPTGRQCPWSAGTSCLPWPGNGEASSSMMTRMECCVSTVNTSQDSESWEQEIRSFSQFAPSQKSSPPGLYKTSPNKIVDN